MNLKFQCQLKTWDLVMVSFQKAGENLQFLFRVDAYNVSFANNVVSLLFWKYCYIYLSLHHH